jgi:hypothetical protein
VSCLAVFPSIPIRDCPYLKVAPRLYFPTLDRWFVALLSTLLVRSSHSILDYLEWRTGLVATVNPVSEGVSTRSLKQTGLSKDRDLSRAKMALSPLPGKISATGEAPGGRLLYHL